jgi:uncharacterized protein (TIGR02996 family)
MTTESAFLTAIHADPGDRMTYAVFADWLEEHGDPRAELLRALADLRAALPDKLAERQARAQSLLAGPAGARLRRLAGVGEVSPDPRGLLTLEPKGIPPAEVPLSDEWGWITEIVVKRLGMLRQVHELTDHLPLLRRLTLVPVPANLLIWSRYVQEIASRSLDIRLRVGAGPWTMQQVQCVGRDYPSGWLRELSLCAGGIRDVHLHELSGQASLSELRRLELDNNPITPDGVRVLADSAGLGKLEVLTLNGTSLTDEGVVLLAERRHLPALRELHLDHTRVTIAGIATWLRAGLAPPGDLSVSTYALHFERVTTGEGNHLSVTLDEYPGTQAADLASLPGLEGTVALTLGRTRNWQPGDTARLLALPELRGLRALSHGPNNLGMLSVALVREILACPVAATLEELSLPGGLAPESYAAVVDSPLFGTARKIVLDRGNHMALRLEVEPDGPVRLTLRRPSLRLIEALARSPGLARVTEVRVENPDSGRAARVARLLPPGVVRFTLAESTLTEADLRGLMAALPAGQLDELSLPLADLPHDSPVVAELRRRFPVVEVRQ